MIGKCYGCGEIHRLFNHGLCNGCKPTKNLDSKNVMDVLFTYDSFIENEDQVAHQLSFEEMTGEKVMQIF